MTPTLRTLYPGCYRITLTADHFGQIKRVGSLWHAEVRMVDGTLVRFAGIWSTRRDAVEELQQIKLF